MSCTSALLAIPHHLAIIGLKARQSCLDVWARIALKRQLSLMIHTTMDRSGASDRVRSQKQQSECVFHRAFKLSNVREEIRAPASLRRNLFSCVALSVFVLVGGCTDQSSQYTGIWKNHCDDYWGVQVKSSVGGLYAVTFCGLSGCLDPGEWMPDTLIVSDPDYQVIAPDQIRITRGNNPSLTYIRCNKDPSWAIKGP